jgi:hypothetical protein
MNIFLSILLSLLGRALGAFVAISFGRFLGSEGTAIMTKGTNLLLFAILILGLIFLFRLYSIRLKKKYGFRLVFIMYLSLLFFISFFCYFLRIYLLSRLGLHLGDLFYFIILSVGGLPLPAPSERPAIDLSLPPSPSPELSELMDQLSQADEKMQRLLEARVESREDLDAWEREAARLKTFLSEAEQTIRQSEEMDRARAQEQARQRAELDALMAPVLQHEAELAAKRDALEEVRKRLNQQIQAQEAFLKGFRFGGEDPGLCILSLSVELLRILCKSVAKRNVRLRSKPTLGQSKLVWGV